MYQFYPPYWKTFKTKQCVIFFLGGGGRLSFVCVTKMSSIRLTHIIWKLLKQNYVWIYACASLLHLIWRVQFVKGAKSSSGTEPTPSNITVFVKASLSLIGYVWIHCTTYLSKVCETVFLKINPASVKLAVICKTLWPPALFQKLSKKGVIFGYMKIKDGVTKQTEPTFVRDDTKKNVQNLGTCPK